MAAWLSWKATLRTKKAICKRENDDLVPRLLKEEVDEDDIAAVVARSTGIPLTKTLGCKRENCFNSETIRTKASSAREMPCKTGPVG